MLLNKVLPVIYEKWPRGSCSGPPEIIIQEDNAKPHKKSIRDAVAAEDKRL